MTYFSGQSLGFQVVKLQPNHVMVAYLGTDWSKFLPEIAKVVRLVVQPNPPTSPKAIDDIVEIIGWDKIQFLDNLHAKVYIHLNEDKKTGKAIVGSPNLTANGLGGKGLYEAAVRFDFGLTKDGDQNNPLKSFNEAWNQASNQYSDENKKIARLKKLKEDFIKYFEGVERIFQNNQINTNRSICEYGSDWKGDFWPAWWSVAEDVVYAEESDANQLDKQNRISDFCALPNDDQIIEKNLYGKWILHWKITENNKLDLRSNPEWLYIHYAYPDTCPLESPYCGVLIEDSRRNLPNPPFLLDEKIKRAMKKVLAQPKYSSFWEEPDDNTGWRTQQMNELMSDWLADVIKLYGSL